MRSSSLLLVFIALLFSSSVQAQVVINEFYNSTSNDFDWVELVVTETTSLTGVTIQSYTENGLVNPNNSLAFNEHPLWEEVPAGTIILIMGARSPFSENFNIADRKISVRVQNSTYLSSGSLGFEAVSGAVQILRGETHMHGISWGTNNSQSLPQSGVYLGETVFNSARAFAFLGTQSFSDFLDAQKVALVSTFTPSQANDTDNNTLISSVLNVPNGKHILVEWNGFSLQENATTVGWFRVGRSYPIEFIVTSVGSEPVRVVSITSSNPELSFSLASDSTLSFGDIIEGTIDVESSSPGDVTAQISVQLEGQENQIFAVDIHFFNQNTVVPMSVVKAMEIGETATTVGVVTVANEFGGPSYFQDESWGISVFNSALSSDVSIGDSIRVSGTLNEFGSDAEGNGLFQFGADVTFENFGNATLPFTPLILPANEIGERHEGLLVTVRAATVASSGALSANTNYSIVDASGAIQIRIDGDTDIPGFNLGGKPADVTGVVSEFRGTRQLMPRSRTDFTLLEAEPRPGDDVPFDKSFDVVTWNIEWFGSTSSGPNDITLQRANVKSVIESIDADLYALQEIASETQFRSLVNSLPAYSGFRAQYSQSQRTAYIFKKEVIDSLSSGLLNVGDTFPFAGRQPQYFRFDATINGITIENLFAVNIHAKAFSDASSWERRSQASVILKNILDDDYNSHHVLFLGDYNDDVDVSTYNQEISPYQNFVSDDQNYNVVTRRLSLLKISSYKSGSDMIDHITISDELFNDYIPESSEVILPNVNNFTSTTSDHFPVLSRFILGGYVSAENELPEQTSLLNAYPNPFNPTTTISLSISASSTVTVNVYDVLGRHVATLVDGFLASGRHQLRFDGTHLSSGIYLINAIQDGVPVARTTVTLIK